MARYLFLFFFSFSCFFGWGQQLPLFTQYANHAEIINPSAVNTDYFYTDTDAKFQALRGSIRNQWEGVFKNFTHLFRYDYFSGNDFSAKDKKGRRLGGSALSLGGYFVYDKVGDTYLIATYTRGAYYRGDVDDFLIGIGANLGFINFGIDWTGYYMNEPDKLCQQAECGMNNASIIDFGIGTYFMKALNNGKVRLYGGFSIPQTRAAVLSFDKDVNYNFNLLRHKYLYLGVYNIYRKSRKQQFLDASIWLKHIKGLSPHIDFMIRAQPDPVFWLGIGGSSAGFVHLEAGIMPGELQRFKVGASFSIPLITLVQAGTTFEFNFAYTFSRY